MAELIVKTNIFDVDFEKGTLKPREAVQLVQYDNKTNLFVFNIKNEIAIGNTLMLKIKHYEGNEFEYPLVIKDNKAQILITNNVTYIPGEIKMTVSLLGTDNRILTTVETIENIPIIEAIQGEMPPEEEVNALIQLISDNNELKKELQELIEDHIRRLNLREYDGIPVEIRKNEEYIQWKYLDEDATKWRNIVLLQDITGPKGDIGQSAYESATIGGFEGTEEEFYKSLASIGDINSVLDNINGEVV